MGPKPYILIMILISLVPGCTVHFEAEKIKMDSEIQKPGLDLEIPLIVPDLNDIVIPLKISSIQLSNREEILCHLSNMEAVLSRCLDRSPKTPLPETVMVTTSGHVPNP